MGDLAVSELAVVIMRGGTSKGVFCPLDALPADEGQRATFLLGLMGSPDPMQLDGLGGTHSSTSKVVAVGPSPEPGVDVDYLFAQVGVDRAVVDLAGNCGNLTAAVGPYAVDEGLVDVPTGKNDTMVMLRNLNTGVRIRATVPLEKGRAAWQGSCAIDGVPGTGAPVVTEYLDPAGSVTGRLLPTGSAVDRIDGVDVSVVDVASPHVFIRAADLGIEGGESPSELNGRPDLLARLEDLRAACGRAIGVDSAAIPRLMLVSAPAAPSADLRVRATSMQVVHHATPITGALCTAAAAVIAGTVAHAVARRGTGASGVVAIEHAKGRVEATVELDGSGQVRAAGVVRTARRLLAGTAYVPCR